MTGNSLFCLIFTLLLVFSLLFAGCSDDSPSAGTTVPTPAHPAAKYRQGDIIATVSSSSASSLYFILKYDATADEYTRALIEKNADGSWGHRTSSRTEKSPRVVLEKVYTVRVGHVEVSAVPVVTSTVPPVTTPARSGNAPSITSISPGFAAKDGVVSVTIIGSNFQDGATVKLVRAGSPPVTTTGTAVSSTEITCFLSLTGKSDGSYNLIVINPDGQSDSRQDFFTIGEAPPVISGIYPAMAELNEKVPLSISGQNFRNDVKVSFTKDLTELVCDNPITMDSTKISCNLDLTTMRGASTGEWTVTVLNIKSQQKGTCAKKFIVTNSTTDED